MSVIEIGPERRRRRSSNTYEAIRLQLDYIAKTQNLRNFTLGDNRGLTLAHSGEDFEAEILAAYAPLLAKCLDRQKRAQIFERLQHFVPTASEQSLQIRTFAVDGEVLHLAVLAENTVKHTDLYRAATGVRRILDQGTSQARAAS